MKEQDLRSTLKKFEDELQEAESVAQRAVVRADSVRKIVEGLRAYIKTEMDDPGAVPLFESATPPPQMENGHIAPQDLPRGREAARRLLIEKRGKMSAKEMAARARELGWMTDAANLERALNVSARRLVKDGEADLAGPRTYRYRLDKLPPPVEEMG